jgi:hypothetical protein
VTHRTGWPAALLALLCSTCVLADPALDALERDVDRVESIRAVKDLQSSYAQYAQYGLWREVGKLFAADGRLRFDGLVQPEQQATGPAAISDFLRTRYGHGREGVYGDSLSTLLIDSPVVTLASDGQAARARWQALIFHGRGAVARIEGGVFQNEYVRQGGVWKFSTVHYFPQFDGAYEAGWTNWGGGDLPVVPKHFSVLTSGIPVTRDMEPPPPARQTLASLQARVDALNDADRIRNLQSAYGFYADRRMWDDVVDLFAADGVVETAGQGIWRGSAGVRRWLQSQGVAGLAHGQLNDRVQNDVIVSISPGGNEAHARGIELGMLGEADQERGWWEVATFHNRFVKEGGVWKIREMRRFVQMKTDIFQGWGRNLIREPAPVAPFAPDVGPAGRARRAAVAVPAFLGRHPVTGRTVKAAGEGRLVAKRPITGAIAQRSASPVTIEEARRRLARSAAWDGAANVSAAYGFYVDDMDTAGWAGVMATNGFKETPFQGYHIGRDRLIAARLRGSAPVKQPGISYHWLMQPVILVSEDGRSATGRFRLFQPRTGKTVGKAGDFFAASFWGGMYHDRYVLENGTWRIWELSLDEPYITPVAWQDGVWAKAKDPAPRPQGLPPRAASNTTNVDIPLSALGRREAHFTGGTGEPRQWPSILPMWFSYRNPVSGREPEFFQPDCVPCVLRPDLRLEHHGYEEPPDAPAANRSP